MTSATETEQRWRAREHFKVHYCALYDRVQEILVQTDPLGYPPVRRTHRIDAGD